MYESERDNPSMPLSLPLPARKRGLFAKLKREQQPRVPVRRKEIFWGIAAPSRSSLYAERCVMDCKTNQPTTPDGSALNVQKRRLPSDIYLPTYTPFPRSNDFSQLRPEKLQKACHIHKHSFPLAVPAATHCSVGWN